MLLSAICYLVARQRHGVRRNRHVRGTQKTRNLLPLPTSAFVVRFRTHHLVPNVTDNLDRKFVDVSREERHQVVWLAFVGRAEVGVPRYDALRFRLLDNVGVPDMQ